MPYYDTKGKLVSRSFPKTVTVAPLVSTGIFTPEDETIGGIGANFIVKWQAQKEINVPVIESVMIGMKSGQGISFVGKGQEL